MSKREAPDWEDVRWIMDCYWLNANQQLRNEIIKKLNKCRLPPTSLYGVDCRFAIDYSGDMFRCGNKCVYVWVTENCNIAYIGCGSYDRAANPKAKRNDAFETMFKNENMKSFAICFNADDETVQEIETLIIWEAQLKGFHLTNDDKLLSNVEIMAMSDERYSNCDVVQKYSYMKEQYSECLAAFGKLCSYCLDFLLTDEGKLDYDIVFEHGKDRQKFQRVTHVWTIDGVTKSGKEWASDYNFPLGKATYRIRQYGCTPKEALTFPTMPKEIANSHNISMLDFWKGRGCIPNTDKTSFITPADQWPEKYISYKIW